MQQWEGGALVADQRDPAQSEVKGSVCRKGVVEGGLHWSRSTSWGRERQPRASGKARALPTDERGNVVRTAKGDLEVRIQC